MYDDSAGAMYEQEEYEQKKLRRKKMLLIRRIIVVSILSIIALYTILYLIDSARFKRGLNPLIMFKEVTKNYNDGTVTSKYSIGWVFREYNRESLVDTEMVPIWNKIRQDYDASAVVSDDLPSVITDYEVPDNPDELDNVDGVLFLYKDGTLLGTYKCLYTCEIASSYLYNDEVSTYDIKMDIVDKRYAFIKEIENQGTESESYITYLYDIKNKVYISKFEDVHSIKLENGKGAIDSSKYIVKKNGLWGMDQVVNGKVQNILNYEYYGINYLTNSKKYLLKKSDGYQVYDANENTFSETITDKIDDIIEVNGTNYYTIKMAGDTGNIYQLYNEDTKESLLPEGVSYISLNLNYVTYVLNNKLYLCDYSGKDLLNTDISLYFDNYDGSGVLAYYIMIISNQLRISTPRTNESTHYVDEYYFDTITYEFIKKRDNVRETVN